MPRQQQTAEPLNGRHYNLGTPTGNYTPGSMTEREQAEMQWQAELDHREREERMSMVEGMMQISMQHVAQTLDKLDNQMTRQKCTRVRHTRFIDY